MIRHKQQLETVPDRILTLLSEISASTSRHEVPENAEAELMRLSADPFLLRRHLYGIEGKGDKKTSSLRRPSHALGTWISSAGAETKTTSESIGKGRHYHSIEPAMRTSLLPEVFAATDEDLADALEGYPVTHTEVLQERAADKSFVSVQVILASLLFSLAVLVAAVLADLFFS